MTDIVETTSARAHLGALIAECKLSQAGLADLLGVSTMTVSRWVVESGHATSIPDYAIFFVLAYEMLDDERRATLQRRMKLAKAKAEPFHLPIPRFAFAVLEVFALLGQAERRELIARIRAGPGPPT